VWLIYWKKKLRQNALAEYRQVFEDAATPCSMEALSPCNFTDSRSTSDGAHAIKAFCDRTDCRHDMPKEFTSLMKLERRKIHFGIMRQVNGKFLRLIHEFHFAFTEIFREISPCFTNLKSGIKTISQPMPLSTSLQPLIFQSSIIPIWIKNVKRTYVLLHWCPIPCGSLVRRILVGAFSQRKIPCSTGSHFLENYDWIRTGLMFEPQGHDMGCRAPMAFPPHLTPEKWFRLSLIEDFGCLPHVRSRTILAPSPLQSKEGWIHPKTPGSKNGKAPAGLVLIEYKQEGEKGQTVKWRHVKAYFGSRKSLKLESDELGGKTQAWMCSTEVISTACAHPSGKFPGLEHFKPSNLISIGGESSCQKWNER